MPPPDPPRTRSAPPRPSGRRAPPGDGLELRIDPELIEEALQAVDRRHRPAPGRSTGATAPEPGAVEVLFDVDPAEPAEPPEEASRDALPPDDGEFSVPPELADLLESTEAHARPGPQAPSDAPLLAAIAQRDAHIGVLDREVRDLREARLLLEGQLHELRQSSSQLTAEFERYRVRARRDREEAERSGEERAIVLLLDVGDHLTRARSHAPDDGSPLARGLTMVAEQLRSRLRRLGVEPVPAEVGAPFDPEVHEAMQRVPTGDQPPNTVVAELTAGYRHRGRLLRAARVAVSAALPAPAPPSEQPTVAAPPAPPEPARAADAREADDEPSTPRFLDLAPLADDPAPDEPDAETTSTAPENG